MSRDNFDIMEPMSIRDAARALVAEWDGGSASEATMAPLFDRLKASIDGSPTKPGDLPDVTLALATIAAMKAGQPIAPGGVQAVVALAEIGFEQLEQFEVRWAADMRAIARWRAAAPDGEDRALTLPDHADLVVWLMDGLDAPFEGPTIAEVETMQARLKAEHDRSGKAVDTDANAMLGRMAVALRAMARRAYVAEQAAANSIPLHYGSSLAPGTNEINSSHAGMSVDQVAGIIQSLSPSAVNG